MIKVICLGKLKEKYLEEMVSDYQKRINKYHKLEMIELKEQINIEKEAENILNIINNKDYVVLLDLNGNKTNSLEFASLMDKVFSNGYGNIIYVIGSSLGVAKSVKERADSVISFGDITIPHGIFRGVLLEQIYRNFKILNNEKYHK